MLRKEELQSDQKTPSSEQTKTGKLVGVTKYVFHLMHELFSASFLSHRHPKNAELKSQTLQDWIKALDDLQLVVQQHREQIDPMRLQSVDMNMLGVCTYLFHTERILNKIREFLLSFRYRQEQLIQEKRTLNFLEYVKVNVAGHKCFRTMVDLYDDLKKPLTKQLYSDAFVAKVHTLEHDANNLMIAMQDFNKYLYRQDAILQITQLEQNLLHTLVQSQLNTNKNIIPLNEMIFGGESQELMAGHLRAKMKTLTDLQDVALLEKIIDGYDMLKKCYVIARKSVIKDTLDEIGENIELLIKEITHHNETRIYYHLYCIYHKIESLRFSCNRESRCSRNLADKTKIVRHQFRKACAKHPLGQVFLKQISLPAASWVKSNKSK